MAGRLCENFSCNFRKASDLPLNFEIPGGIGPKLFVYWSNTVFVGFGPIPVRSMSAILRRSNFSRDQLTFFISDYLATTRPSTIVTVFSSIVTIDFFGNGRPRWKAGRSRLSGTSLKF